MSDQNSLINFEQVNEMLDNDPEYVKEFCAAAINSFESFNEEFKQHMQNRNIENLRKAGHRIKPVAQMLDIEALTAEYEKGKNILENKESKGKIDGSIERVELLIEQVLNEFRNKIE